MSDSFVWYIVWGEEIIVSSMRMHVERAEKRHEKNKFPTHKKDR